MILRVIHVASGREWRGGQRQVWLLARELARRCEVEQVVLTGAGTELARRLHGAGVRVREVSWRAGLDPRALAGVLTEARRNPAILHAHDGHAVTLAGVGAALMGRPLVVTRRVDFPLRRAGFWRRADRVIAVSQAVADALIADGITRDRITVVHSGIAVEVTRAAARLGIRERLGLPGTARIAANVAALVPHKDHALLLHTAHRLAPRFPSLHWVIAGEGAERRALEGLRDRLSLKDRVHLVGQVDEPQRLIADADIFVMCSRAEGLGTSVLEAMALGIPIASTSAGGLPEMLRRGAGLLVPPEQPDALADAVARILAQPGLGAALAAQAGLEVQRFTAGRMAEEVASVYRSCASLH